MKAFTQAELDAFTTLEQFRDYFAGIPEDMWCVDNFLLTGFESGRSIQCCAEGWLGERDDNDTPDAVQTLSNLLRPLLPEGCSVVGINDGHNFHFQQPTPRARILAAIDEAIAKRDLKV